MAVRLDDEVVLISGAGRGLGRCHALLFAERGAHVVVNDVDADVADRTTAEIAASGGSAVSAPGDVRTDAAAIVQVAIERWGGIDVLVNNAGVAHVAPFDADAVRSTELLFDQHVVTTVGLTAAAWESLVARTGRVVNTSSPAAFGLLHHTAYAAAKGAIVGFTRSLAIEAEPLGVKVNAIFPMARTRMFEQAGGVAGSAEDQLLTERFPPESISPVAVWLGHRDVRFSGQLVEISAGSAGLVEAGLRGPIPFSTPEDGDELVRLRSGRELVPFDGLHDLMTIKLAGRGEAPG